MMHHRARRNTANPMTILRRSVVAVVAVVSIAVLGACTPEQVLAIAAERGITLTHDQAAAVSLRYRAQTPAGAREVGAALVEAEGWPARQFDCLNSLWGDHESGWDWSADNPKSSAYGIPQALPGSKMASHGKDWRTNGYVQITWGLDYIKDRYDTPCGALAARRAKGWY